MTRFLILFCMLQVSSIKAESLTLGYFVLGPHIYHDVNGNAAGPLPEFLMKHIGPAMGVELSLVNMPLARVLKGVKTGRLAGAALLGFTEARNLTFAYPRNSFVSMQPVIAVLKNHTLTKVESVDDIANLSIGYVKDAITSPFMQSNGIVFTDIFGSNTWERNIQRLMKGHIDVAYSPIDTNMRYVAAKLNVLDKIRIMSLPEEPMKLYSVFSKHKKFINSNFAKRYDEAFEHIQGEKLYKEIFSRYYITSHH